MTVLHIITRLILGGAQQNTVMSCAAQVEAGHEVHLAYGPIYGPEGSLLDAARASGATLHEVRWMRRAVLPVHDVLCYRALRRIIRAVKPDVVHTHSSKAGIVGRAAAWAEHVPGVIHTIHGLPFHDRQSRLVHKAYVAAERWAARRCHRMIGITQAMCDAFIEHGIGHPEQFTVIPSGIDVDAFTRDGLPRGQAKAAFNIEPTAPVVGLVARFDPLKGHADLLDVIPRLRTSHPNLRVLFVGDGWHRRAIEERVARDGLTDGVRFTGLLPLERVPDAMRAMDVMVLPSYQEGQGRTLAEALLSGCAIVGYDVGGIGAICIDGQTGRLVPCGDRDALADSIAWTLDHPAEREAMVARGRDHVIENFSRHAMVQRIETLYGETIDKAESGKRKADK